MILRTRASSRGAVVVVCGRNGQWRPDLSEGRTSQVRRPERGFHDPASKSGAGNQARAGHRLGAGHRRHRTFRNCQYRNAARCEADGLRVEAQAHRASLALTAIRAPRCPSRRRRVGTVRQLRQLDIAPHAPLAAWGSLLVGRGKTTYIFRLPACLSFACDQDCQTVIRSWAARNVPPCQASAKHPGSPQPMVPAHRLPSR